MKKFISLFIVSFCLLTSYSQEWKWSNQFITDGTVNITSIKTGLDNSVYVVGYFTGTSLTLGSFSLTNDGNWDGFVGKIDNAGNVLWLNQISSSDRDEISSVVIVGNDLYVFGSYKANVFFNGSNPLGNYNNYDAFWVRYDLDGNFISNDTLFYGPGVERVKDVEYNSTNNEFVVLSQFKDSIYYADAVGNQKVQARSISNKDLIVALTSLTGVVQDTLICTTSVQNSIFNDISLTPDNGYILTGDLFGTVYFNQTDSISGINDATPDVVIAQLNSSLDLNWARSGGGSNWDHGNSSASDIYGNIYITGQVQGSDVYFDSTSTLQSALIPEVGNEDIFVTKYNTNGILQWIKRKGDAGKDDGYGLVQYENLVQFSGNFTGEVVFNVDTLRSSGIGDFNTSFATFTPDGNEIGAQGIGGLGIDVGQAIAFDNNLNTIIGGYFTSTSIDIGDSTYANASGYQHGFIASYFYPFNAVLEQTSDIVCNGSNTASLLANHYFGVGPYTYKWSTNVIDYNDSVAINLPAGTYEVTITDSRDSSAFTQIVIGEPSAINIQLDSSDLTCYESGDGAITATVTGGTPTFTYAWAGPSGDNPSAKDQSSLVAGEYVLTVTDAENCQAKDSINVMQPDKITFGNVVVTNADPAGTGTINLDASGGTGAFTYAWVFNSTDSLIGRVYDSLQYLDEGDYISYITDENLCQVDTTITVGGALLRVNLIGTDVACYNDGNGSAYPVIISGDKGFGYTYYFEDELGQEITPDGDTIRNLGPGKYFVTATEQGGENRTALDSVTISQPDTLALTFDSDSVLCYGNSNGAITLTVSGGNGSVSYAWSNGANSKNLSGISTGWYSVEVTDAKSCITIDSAEVEGPDSLIAGLSLRQPIKCFGQINGQLEAIVSGGTSSYSFLWDDPANQVTQIAINLTSGDYSVQVTDANGCKSSSPVYQLTDPLPLSYANVDTNNVTCRNANDGSISITMAGGEAPYTYSWNQAGLGDTSFVENLFPIFYEVTVTDANGCTIDPLSFLVEQPNVALSIEEVTASHKNNVCYAATLGELEVSATGGWGNYIYSRDLIDWQDTPVFDGLIASNYTISVKDTFGCVVGVSIPVTEPEELALSVSSSGNTIVVEGQGGTGPYTYAIDGGVFQTVGSFLGLTGGSHTVEVTDANTCGPVSEIISLTSVELNELNKFLDIYPNPSSGMFNLEFNIQSDTELLISVYSIIGSKVYTNTKVLSAGPSQIISIDLTDQQAGVYLLEINGVVLDKKLIVK